MNTEQLAEYKQHSQAGFKLLDRLILETPTGSLREKLTEINIQFGVANLIVTGTQK